MRTIWINVTRTLSILQSVFLLNSTELTNTMHLIFCIKCYTTTEQNTNNKLSTNKTKYSKRLYATVRENTEGRVGNILWVWGSSEPKEWGLRFSYQCTWGLQCSGCNTIRYCTNETKMHNTTVISKYSFKELYEITLMCNLCTSRLCCISDATYLCSWTYF
jgi:hypothetical protein